MGRNALFFMCRMGVRDCDCAGSTEQRCIVEKVSPSTKLRQVAQLRIQQLFGSALTETGESLPLNVRDGIERIINGPHKTFRYMLMTGLLVAVSDSRLNPRCLQMNAGCEGAYDARSLCQKVIVPFEKTFLQGRLGASNEPFANKTARADMIDEHIHVRKGIDTIPLRNRGRVRRRSATLTWNLRTGGATRLR